VPATADYANGHTKRPTERDLNAFGLSDRKLRPSRLRTRGERCSDPKRLFNAGISHFVGLRPFIDDTSLPAATAEQMHAIKQRLSNVEAIGDEGTIRATTRKLTDPLAEDWPWISSTSPWCFGHCAMTVAATLRTAGRQLGGKVVSH